MGQEEHSIFDGLANFLKCWACDTHGDFTLLFEVCKNIICTHHRQSMSATVLNRVVKPPNARPVGVTRRVQTEIHFKSQEAREINAGIALENSKDQSITIIGGYPKR